MKILNVFLIGCLKGYQKFLSPDHNIFGVRSYRYGCRFYPSCSEYAIQSLRQYGLLKGSIVSMKRIFRCHPFSHGGYDPLQ